MSEYKEITRQLVKHGILEEPVWQRLQTLTCYPNRLVHFFNEVTRDELYNLCWNKLKDLETVVQHLKSRLSKKCLTSGRYPVNSVLKPTTANLIWNPSL